MNEMNRDSIERESDIDNANSTSAFHEHTWWIAIVVGIVVVMARNTKMRKAEYFLLSNGF
jgi:hypothetical protein